MVERYGVREPGFRFYDVDEDEIPNAAGLPHSITELLLGGVGAAGVEAVEIQDRV
jgi:hypothetical protein